MTVVRIALANLVPESADGSVVRAVEAISDAASAGAAVICFPECYVPGYRGLGLEPPPPNQAWLDDAWATLSSAAARAGIGAIIGTERVVDGAVIPTALVINPDGTRAGFQDKVQLDPSEDSIYTPGVDRRVFTIGALKFGVAICHEGWRYPETVRWAAYHGAEMVFHPHFHPPEAGGYVSVTFADPRNTFHEKAMLCRAAENGCYFASVNYAVAGSPTTSAVVRPDGTLLVYQAYGVAGLLLADLDLSTATRLLAMRHRTIV